MQAPGDNSITGVDPQVQSCADNNINEKNLGTQYIYTTEGQLIPTSSEQILTSMDLSSQHYNTVHVTEAQDMHIQQVNYQYQQQYPDGTVQQVVPVSGTAFVQDEETTYMINQTAYMPTNTQEIVETTEEEVYPNQVVTETNSESSAYVYNTTERQENYDTDQPEAGFVSEYAASENDPKNTQQIVESSHNNIEEETGGLDLVSEGVGETAENVETRQNDPGVVVAEQVSQEVTPATENVDENSELQANVEIKDQEIITNQQQESVEKEVELSSIPDAVKASQPGNQGHNEHSENNLEESQEVQVEHVIEEPSNQDKTVEVVKNELVQKEVVPKQVQTDSKPNENQEELAEIQEETTIGLNEQDSSQNNAPAEEDQCYLAETRSEQTTDSRNSTSSIEPSQPPRPRGRKPKTDIPLHILGHDVNKPMENIVNGKTPKPRLGVKVPYRNLTSQIVSKEELEREIVERGRKKQEEKKEEVMFARQLTSRLAKKIAPESSEKSFSTNKSKTNTKREKSSSEVEVITQENQQMDVDDKDKEGKPKSAIDNNSDLLAILEGDDDGEELPVLSKDESQPKESTPTDETNIKNLEREIALQQLQDLPYLSPSTRFVKGKAVKELTPSLSEGSATKTQHGEIISVANKQNSAKGKSPIKGSPIKHSLDKKMMEVEPQIKVNMALKTYSRKRKSSDSMTESPSPSKKTSVMVNASEIDIKPSMQTPATGDVYVTKSSRVIKKKVIWDPDESSPARLTPIKQTFVKVESSTHRKPSPKPVQPKNDNRSADLTKKSAVETKIKTEKKGEEKPIPKKSVNSPVEKRTSSVSKTAIKPKKVKSEVDRLLGDEGAIKMLYDLKTSEDHIEEKRKKTVISVEKTFKELAKKAIQIKSDLVSTSTVESPKSLRKKEPTVSPVSIPAAKVTPPPSVSVPVVPSGISRQKSKDSSRSTPPPSPAFSFPNETSYLIRRRSSSSISSGDDTGGSVEFDDIEDRTPRKKSANSSLTDPLKIKKSKKSSESYESQRSQKRAENRIGQFNTFSFKKFNKSITIDLYTESRTDCYFTSELLDELTTALNKMSKEKDCNVVLIKSNQSSIFSLGLDYEELISDKENIRKNKAIELADRVSNFIQCLLDFPKILVAGVQGECVGLGVTMLPLFDIVIGSDNASFSTPYSTIGTVAEAGFLLTPPHVASHGLAGELLYASQKLTADEAFRRGLISKLCWPEKYHDTLKATLVSITKGSKQSLEATKKQVRSSIRESTQEAIDVMSDQLIDHWTSNECQSNFLKIVK